MLASVQDQTQAVTPRHMEVGYCARPHGIASDRPSAAHGTVNRYAQTSEVMRKSGPGRKPDRDFVLLQDCCQAQLLDPGLAADAVQFMSLQASVPSEGREDSA